MAEDNIRNGARADALAVYESFPHFIFKLNKDRKISVSDNDPFGGRVKDVHNSLYTALKFYAETLNGPAPERERAWRAVLACFERNNFTERDKQRICQEFYNSLERYVTQFGFHAKVAALVLVRASPLMGYYDEGIYGGFGKRGARTEFTPRDFSNQIWTGKFDVDKQAARQKIVKRGVHAILYMASRAQ